MNESYYRVRIEVARRILEDGALEWTRLNAITSPAKDKCFLPDDISVSSFLDDPDDTATLLKGHQFHFAMSRREQRGYFSQEKSEDVRTEPFGAILDDEAK
jgi:hypothetical protein